MLSLLEFSLMIGFVPLHTLKSTALHVLDDMVKNREATVDRGHYATLINMPAGRRKHAEAIYAKISPNSIVKKMPKAHVCANFLPDGVCTHGVKTSNFSEVQNKMLLPMRLEESMYRCLVVCLHTLEARTRFLRNQVCEVKRGAEQAAPGYGQAWPSGPSRRYVPDVHKNWVRSPAPLAHSLAHAAQCKCMSRAAATTCRD